MRYDIDTLARSLAELGRMGAAMPPTWDGCKQAPIVCSGDGGIIGKLLPGKGLLLFDDLRNVGIMQPLPFVFERSPAFRLWDLLKSERGAITTYAGLKTALAAKKYGSSVTYGKTFTATSTRWYHSFKSSGWPTAGSYSNIPGGSAPDGNSAGALNYGMTQPASGDKAFLVSLGAGTTSAILDMAFLIDLLVAADNISANVSTAQTVNTTALTRYTSGSGVLMFFEVTTALGASAANFTVTKYTNQSGTTLRASAAAALDTSATVQRMPYALSAMPFFNLQDGDYGVKSIEEVQLSAAMGSGVLAACLAIPLAVIPSMPFAAVAAKRDSMSNIDGATEIAKTTGNVMGCLSLLQKWSSNASVTLQGDLDVAIGS